MKFNEYQDAIEEMPLYDNVVYGLIGEVGEVVELIKKDDRRGERRKALSQDHLTEELGDILWYLTRLASKYGISMDTIAKKNITKLTERHAA